jgi:hypothetical protein
MKPRRPWDDAKYRQRRAQVMRGITAHTRCWRCGKTAPEHPLHSNGRPGHWQCGHVVDGDNRGPLAAEFSTCNLSAGGALGYKRGIGRELAARTAEPHYPGHYDLTDAAAPSAAPCLKHQGTLCPTCADWRAKNPTKRG